MTDTVAPVLDAGSTRVAAYLIVSALAAAWYVRERRAVAEGGERDALWPVYWLLTALVLLTMGIGRAGALGDAVAELGREQARSSGWYERRRSLQIIASATIITAWFVGVVIAIWRVPPRRRRYLASVVSISALAAFAAVRLISLHQIDAVLYRRGLGDVRLVAVAELALLLIAAAAVAVVRRIPAPVGPAPAPHPAAPGTGVASSGETTRAPGGRA